LRNFNDLYAIWWPMQCGRSSDGWPIARSEVVPVVWTDFPHRGCVVECSGVVRNGSLAAPSPPSSHSMPCRQEIETAAHRGPERTNFGCRLGGFCLLGHPDDRLRIGDFLFKCENCLPQQGDRPRFALGKVFARFLSLLRLIASWSTNQAQDAAVECGVCNEGAGVECSGEIIPKVERRAVPECRRQGFVDASFEREDFRNAKSLQHVLGIESVNAFDALPKPLNATPLLFQRKARGAKLGRRDGMGRHAVHPECVMVDILARRPEKYTSVGVANVWLALRTDDRQVQPSILKPLTFSASSRVT
jgi:hypothetical protein